MSSTDVFAEQKAAADAGTPAAAPPVDEDVDPVAQAEIDKADPNNNKPTGNELNKVPVLLEGQTVEVTGGPYKGRMAVVTGHSFDDSMEELKFVTANFPGRWFADVTDYILKTRDAKNEHISVPAADVKALDVVDGWSRGQS